MKKMEYLVKEIADKFNLLSAAAVVMIMLVIVLDITMRLFRISLPGAYDIVSLLGTVVIAFSLTYTTVQQGHIAVDLVYQKLPEKIVPHKVCLHLNILAKSQVGSGMGGQSPDTPGKTYYIGLTLKFYLFKFYSLLLG